MTKPLCKIDGCGKTVVSWGWCSPHYQRWRKYGDPLMGEPLRGAPMEFAEQAIKSNTNECIEWPFCRSSAGYGRLSVNNRPTFAHRFVLSQVTGEPVVNKFDCAHRPECHNRSCVNPRHLYWASRAENERDKITNGTSNRGGRNGNAKITDSDAIEIIKGPETVEFYAAKFEISISRAKHIRAGHAWKHLHV